LHKSLRRRGRWKKRYFFVCFVCLFWFVSLTSVCLLSLQERERREVAEMRKRMVHQAQPIREYQPFVVKPSNKTLTEPASPMIGHKRKQSIVS